ncbi:MAG TPA: ATP-binding protein [Anaerolineaceae bacterium]|nr:ATP-binding protein [Anaerolineaceae bacterium]
MDGFFSQLFDILTTPPGNLIYHLILAFAVAFALQAVLIGRRNTSYPFIRRLVIGLLLALAGQIILFGSSGFAWQKLADSHSFLPPLDRAVTAFGLLWLCWLWAVPHPNRVIDSITIVLNLAIVVFAIYTLSVWVTSAIKEPSFNKTWYAWAWELFSLMIVLGGMLILLIQRPEAWGLGFSILLINLLGLTIQLFWPAASDYAGPVRLAQLCSFPLLPLIAQRMQAYPHGDTSETSYADSAPSEKRTHNADPRAVNAWLLLANENDPAHMNQAMARAISQTMLADMCLIISKPGRRGEMTIHGGYDLVREEDLPGGGTEQNKLPGVANAIQRNRPLRIEAGTNSNPDLKHLAELIGLKEAGNLLVLPVGVENKPWGAILLLSPYSNRVWTNEDQSLLTSSTSLILEVLNSGTTQDNSQAELNRVHMDLESMRSMLDQMSIENQRLQSQLTESQGRLTAKTSAETPVPATRYGEMDALVAVQKESQDMIATLQAENHRLQTAVDEERLKVALAPPNTSGINDQEMQHMEMELRLSLQQVAQLQNMLADANMKIVELEKQAAGHVDKQTSEEREMITALVQDIRQPMSSIMGYTELILSETVGILGALQRKFVERIRFSTERMRTLLDELVRLTILPGMQAEFHPQFINMNSVLDFALAETSSMMREKKITLRVDLPEELPRISADEDSIQQILVQLMQNSTAATPVEGTISLNFRLENIETGQLYLLMQITDSGGGINAEDLPRVFERRYRAEHPLIQGIGDNGIGLSVAKALVDAHSGRIWVDSVPGLSSTFSVLLPIKTITPSEIIQAGKEAGTPAKE